MLRRYDVKGCRGFIIEYYGEGLRNLSTWDRHVIANMGTEMGATATVFPSDEVTRSFMKQQQRGDSWVALKADKDATYDKNDEIEMSLLEPLIACPSSPGKVVRVSEVAGKEVSQVVVGSSANPGLRDFWIVAEMIKGKMVSKHVSLDINPSSRQVFQNMVHFGMVETMLQSGARLHQTGCMGCIGMGQAPASGKISLRTMPRNFPGRSGTLDDQVYLCSPETAAASAIMGVITDPRDFAAKQEVKFEAWKEPRIVLTSAATFISPNGKAGKHDTLEKGPNIKAIPEFSKLDDGFVVPVILKMKDNISTDEILKAGADVLPLRSNIEELSKYSYWVIDKQFYNRALQQPKRTEGLW
jgi:aconitate hydratase